MTAAGINVTQNLGPGAAGPAASTSVQTDCHWARSGFCLWGRAFRGAELIDQAASSPPDWLGLFFHLVRDPRRAGVGAELAPGGLVGSDAPGDPSGSDVGKAGARPSEVAPARLQTET